MRFYAACLASYNNGVLHGAWIDASTDTDEMQEAINTMLRASRFPNVVVSHPETGERVPSAEEWAVHDYESFPSSFGEYPGLDRIAQWVELVEEHDSIDADDLAAIVSNFGTVDYAATELRDNFVGIFDTLRDYTDEAADEMLEAYKVSESIRNYFDYEAFAHDRSLEMTTFRVPSGIAVFHQ